MNINSVDVALDSLQSVMSSSIDDIVGCVAAVVITCILVFSLLFAARKVKESADTPWENL